MKNKLKETRAEWVRKINGAEYIWSIHVLDEHIVAGSDIGIHVFNVKGDKLWEYKTNKNTQGYIIDKYVVAGSGDSHVYCFDIKGDIKWKYKVDRKVVAMDIWKDLIVVCDPWNVYLFNTEGYLMWKRNVNEFHKEDVTLLSVDINEDYIGVGSCTEWNGFLYLFDLNGNLKWRYDVIPELDEGHVNCVSISDGYICAGSADSYIYLFDINGNLKWRYNTWWSEVRFVQIYKEYVGASNNHGTYLLDICGNLKWVYNEPSSLLGYHYIHSGYVATCSYSGMRAGEICLFDIDGNLKMRHIAMKEESTRAIITFDEEQIVDIKEGFECSIAFVHMSDRYLVAGGDGYIYLFMLKEDMYDLGRLVVKHDGYTPEGHLEIYPYYSE